MLKRVLCGVCGNPDINNTPVAVVSVAYNVQTMDSQSPFHPWQDVVCQASTEFICGSVMMMQECIGNHLY